MVAAEPGPSSTATAECAAAALRLEVTPPSTDDAIATFTFRWDGQGSGAASRFVCLVRGDEVELVPRGKKREVTIRAHATELQRIVVYARPHLIAVVPGAAIALFDDPCYGYELTGPLTDPWFVPAPIAYCAPSGAACKDGFSRAEPPRPIEDDLCGSTEHEIRRCAADAVVGLATGAPPRPAKPPADDPYDPMSLATFTAAAPLLVAPRRCGYYSIDTGHEKAALVVGAGERWSLRVDDDGHLAGTFE
jgi:hypothetical protein